MTKPFDREMYLQGVRADIEDQKVALAALIDEVHDAFRTAGGTAEEYTRTQFFQNLLFRAVETTQDGTTDKRAALKVVIVFMRALKAHYKEMAKDPEWIKAHALRKT